MFEEFFKFVVTWSQDRIWLQIVITILLIMFIFGVLTYILLMLRKFYLKMNSENKILDIAKENTDLSKKMILISNEQLLYQKQLEKIYSRFILDSNRLKKILKKISKINDPFYFINLSEESNSVEPHEVTVKSFQSYPLDEILYNTSIIKDNINYLSHILSENNFVRISIWQNDNSTFFSNKGKLTEKIRSANFLSSNSKKELDMNQSIAGRVHRTGVKQVVMDVHNDPDWNKSEKSEYVAILGFPLDSDKVITFDFEKKITLTEEYIVSIAALLLSDLIQIITLSKENLNKENLNKNNMNFFTSTSFSHDNDDEYDDEYDDDEYDEV